MPDIPKAPFMRRRQSISFFFLLLLLGVTDRSITLYLVIKHLQTDIRRPMEG